MPIIKFITGIHQLCTMIFGSVAYLGSLRRRSVVMTAGNLTLTVSKPPSISRVTVKLSPVFSNLDTNVAYNKMSQFYVHLHLTIYL